jgi:phosphoribosylanthranilate isomerase
MGIGHSGSNIQGRIFTFASRNWNWGQAFIFCVFYLVQFRIIKSLVIGLHSMERLLDLVQRTAPYVDAYITDTFDPKTGACGATGKTHDWAVSRQLVRNSPRPVILAGGLTPENVRDAILAARPAGVDAHTGLEAASGRKSEEKVRRFVSEAQEAFRVLRKTTG